MTQYATTTDLETYGMNARALTGVPPSAVTSSLEAASSMADTYLMARYPSPPLTGWPLALRLAVVNIAVYLIVSGYIGFNPDGSHEQIRQRYEDGVRYLKDLSRGVVTLTTAETSPARGPAPRATSRSTAEEW